MSMESIFRSSKVITIPKLTKVSESLPHPLFRVCKLQGLQAGSRVGLRVASAPGLLRAQRTKLLLPKVTTITHSVCPSQLQQLARPHFPVSAFPVSRVASPCGAQV